MGVTLELWELEDEVDDRLERLSADSHSIGLNRLSDALLKHTSPDELFELACRDLVDAGVPDDLVRIAMTAGALWLGAKSAIDNLAMAALAPDLGDEEN